MIILHVVEPFAAGIAVFVKTLAESMPHDTHLILHGERRQVMSAREVKKIFPQKNVRFIRWHSAQRSINPIKDFRALQELYRILQRLKRRNLVDAVHLHSSKSGLLGRLACRMAGVNQVVYTPNGAPFLAGKNPVSNFLYRSLEKLGSGLGGEVVCCSQSELQAYQRLGIKARYINNGVAVSAAPVSAIADKLPGKFRIVTSGRIEHQKNPQAFNQIAQYFAEFEQFEFIWAGDGQDRHVLTAPNVQVTGWLNAVDCKGIIASADLYLSTSLYEGLSFAVLEALALQRPLLLSQCIGNKDAVRNGLNGDLFTTEQDAINKILSYYNNQDMLVVMGDFSQKIAHQDFDMQRNFENYRQVYSGDFRPEQLMSKLSVN